MRTYLACLGTRPEIIKMAALHRTLAERGERVIVLHTGLHETVVDMLYRFFHMGPDLQLASRQRASRQGERTALLLDGVDALVDRARPDVVLVQGDTVSALVGALSGCYHDIPVAHIEAGFRTGERESMPQGVNRALVARLARWHFTPTSHTRDQLLREGIGAGHIAVVGDTVIDAAQWTRKLMNGCGPHNLRVMPSGLAAFIAAHPDKRLLLVTVDPLENWGPPMRNIAAAVGQLLQTHKDLVVVWPLHPDPAVCQEVETFKEFLKPPVRKRLCLTAPVDYLALITLLELCHFTLTDSDGIQEEASALGRPVLIVRHVVQHQELLLAGGGTLVGTDTAHIVAQATHLLLDGVAHHAMQLTTSPFGDGHAAERIADALMADA